MSTAMHGSRPRYGAASRHRSGPAGSRATSLDFELAQQIVAAAENQWARSKQANKPMPLKLVLQTYEAVLRRRGDDPIRDDHTLYKVSSSSTCVHPRQLFMAAAPCLLVQFLIKLQAEQPEARWQDKLAAARKADEIKQRRAKGGSMSKRRSALLAEDRSQAALEKLQKMPSVQPSRPGADVWIAWRQWKAFVQHQKQLRAGTRQISAECRQPGQPVNLERSLESELIKAADEADGFRNEQAVAGDAPLSPAGMTSVSASHAARVDSQKRLARVKESTQFTGPLSGQTTYAGPSVGNRSPPVTQHPHSRRVLRWCWRAWRDWLYTRAMEHLASVKDPGTTTVLRTRDVKNLENPAAAISSGHLSSSAAALSPTAKERAKEMREASTDWGLAVENVRRCGRQRGPSCKAMKSAHFLMHKHRLRSTSGTEAKLFARQSLSREHVH